MESIGGENCVIEADPSGQGENDNCSVAGLQSMLCCFGENFQETGKMTAKVKIRKETVDR